MSFGNPIGSGRMAADAIAVPPPPPSEITPWMRPSATIRSSSRGAAPAIADTHSPRSPRATSPGRSMSPAAATSARVMSAGTTASLPVPTSISSTAWPRARIRSATNACSRPFVSSVPMTAIVAMSLFHAGHGRRPSGVFSGMFLNWRVSSGSDCSKASRSRLDAPTNPTTSVCSFT